MLKILKNKQYIEIYQKNNCPATNNIKVKSCRSLGKTILLFSVLVSCNFLVSSCVSKKQNSYNYTDFDDYYQKNSTSFSNPYDFSNEPFNDQDQYYRSPKINDNDNEQSQSIWDIK